MLTITPEEAQTRFGDIMHRATQTFREFEDTEGGIWRPVIVNGKLDSYRLYRLNRVAKRPPTRRR